MRRLVAAAVVASATALAPHTHSRVQRAHVNEHAPTLLLRRRRRHSNGAWHSCYQQQPKPRNSRTPSISRPRPAARHGQTVLRAHVRWSRLVQRREADLIQQATDAESARGAVDSLLRKLGALHALRRAGKVRSVSISYVRRRPSSPVPACRSWTGTTEKSSSWTSSRARPRIKLG